MRFESTGVALALRIGKHIFSVQNVVRKFVKYVLQLSHHIETTRTLMVGYGAEGKIPFVAILHVIVDRIALCSAHLRKTVVMDEFGAHGLNLLTPSKIIKYSCRRAIITHLTPMINVKRVDSATRQNEARSSRWISEFGMTELLTNNDRLGRVVLLR